MHPRNASLVLCGIAAFAALPASANTGTITFLGEITNGTCTVEGGTAALASFTVELPAISVAQLGPGDVAGRTRFPMQLRNCTDVPTTVRTFFEAGPNVDPTFRTLRPSNDGPVHFALFDQDGSRIEIGAELGNTGTRYNPDELMFYEVAYNRVGLTPVVAGEFSTTVTYTLQYD
jgi:major type 1 subunit fimbrin (pilin)